LRVAKAELRQLERKSNRAFKLPMSSTEVDTRPAIRIVADRITAVLGCF
jgi:hypothetical protein